MKISFLHLTHFILWIKCFSFVCAGGLAKTRVIPELSLDMLSPRHLPQCGQNNLVFNFLLSYKLKIVDIVFYNSLYNKTFWIDVIILWIFGV